MAGAVANEPSALAQGVEPRHFTLNERMIHDVTTGSRLDDCNPREVVYELLKQRGPIAYIYPTENYYYFSFFSGGKSYSGSIRLSSEARDQGILQFTCGDTFSNWISPGSQDPIYAALSQTDGVIVKKVSRFEYTVKISDVQTTFYLNQIDQTPNIKNIDKFDAFAGRILDDSGLAFDIIYRKNDKAFLFVLDNNRMIADSFVVLKENVYVGVRTGFVLFHDLPKDRFILVAVNKNEVRNNTAYDGPFDHLPENFYKELGFWSYVYDALPNLIGKLTPSGSYIDAPLIFGLAPYHEYQTREDLRFIDSCLRLHGRGERLECLTGGRQ